MLFICLFLPFFSFTISMFGFTETTRQLGYGMAFDSFAGFLDLLLPLLVVAALAALTGFSVLKLKDAKLYIAGASILGAYLSLALLARLGSASAIGIGLILFFIIWLCVAAAAVMDYKGVEFIKL